MLSQHHSIIDDFLVRYQAPEDEIPFEIRALAAVEIEWELRTIRKKWNDQIPGRPSLELALAPLEKFISNSEAPITRRKLTYLMDLVKDYKQLIKSDHLPHTSN